MLQHPYSCFQDSANAYNSCRLNSFHLIILFIWQFSFHQQTIQTIGWQLSDSQRSDCQYITTKNQTIWQFFRNSWFFWESAIWTTFSHIDQLKLIPPTGNDSYCLLKIHWMVWWPIGDYQAKHHFDDTERILANLQPLKINIYMFINHKTSRIWVSTFCHKQEKHYLCTRKRK